MRLKLALEAPNVKRLSRLVVVPGEAEPFNRCGSRVTAADTIRRGGALYLRPRGTRNVVKVQCVATSHISILQNNIRYVFSKSAASLT